MIKSPSEKGTKRKSTGSKDKDAASVDGNPSGVATPTAKAPANIIEGSSAKKKRVSTPSSGAKKKKIVEAEQNIRAIEDKVSQLQKEQLKLERNMKAAATRRSKAGIKFPVKDNLLPSLCPDSLPAPIPDPKYPYNLPMDLFGDVISIWDFMNTFRTQLSLPTISIESLIDVLNFTGRESVALAEIFSSPLRIILMDSHTTSRIQSDIPKYTSFMHRFSSAEVAYFAVNKHRSLPVPHSDNVIALVNAFGPASVESDFDCQYNGFQLLPRRLQAKLADPLRWQSVLRCMLMRLEPVFAIQRCCRSITPEVLSKVFTERLLRTNPSNNSQPPPPPPPSSLASPMPASRSLSSTIRSPMTAKSQQQTLTPARTRKGVTVNKDILLSLTDDHVNKLANVCDACRMLETHELYALPVVYKIAILKILCDACYETSYFRHLLENNAEDRANSIANMNKIMKDSKNRLKEVSAAKKEAAIAACREINMAAAQGKKSKSKAKKPAAPDTTKKGGKAKDEYEPSQAQLTAMLEDMVLLESLKIDKCVDDVNLDPPEELNEMDIFEDIQTSRNHYKSGRSKEAERARQLREYQYKLDQIDEAKQLLTLSIESGIEKDIKKAIRAAEKAGLKWKDDDGMVYCTELLKQAYKIHSAQEAAAKEERELAEYEKTLSKLYVRTTPLGTDRHGNVYWHFEGAADLLFVQRLSRRVGPWLKTNENRAGGQKQLQRSSSLTSIASSIASSNNNALFPIAENLEEGSSSSSTKQTTTISSSEKQQLAIWEVISSQNEALDKLRELLAQYGYDASGNATAGFSSSQMHKLKSQLKAMFSGLLNEYQLEVLANDPAIAFLYISCPSACQYEWGVYCTANAQWAIWESLDDRGEKERELKAAIKARLGLEEPPTVYLTTGSDYIGRKVRRQFGKRSVIGTITGWVPAEGEDVALWHVEHIDGDEEDLEEDEVIECLIDLEAQDSASASDAVVGKSGESENVAKSTSTQSLTSVNKTVVASDVKYKSNIAGEDEWDENATMVIESDGDEDKEEEVLEEPAIVKSFTGSGRNHQPMKGFMIGLTGLSSELIRAHQSMLDALKKRSPEYSKEIRKLWENSVRDAETLDDIKGLLLELEQVVHSTQKVSDIKDEEERLREQEENKKQMVAEGWLFDSSESDLIGLPCRRFFSGYGSLDGNVVAYLPADKNEGMALWRVVHNDGDEEDLIEDDVRKACRQFAEGLHEDDEGGNDDDKESSSDEESGEEDEVIEEVVSHKGKRSGNEGEARLWSTSGVRQRWISAVNNSQTIGDVALALSALLDFCLCYGVVSEDSSDDIFSSASDRKYNSSSRLSYCGPLTSNAIAGDSSTPRKRKDRSGSFGNSFEDRGRLRRAATRGINYAEF